MGISLGVQFLTISNDTGIRLCVPSSCYSPFPQSLVKAPGELCFEIPAVLKRSYGVVEPMDAYWWSDVQFLPHNDSKFVMTAGAFQPRATQSWVPYKHIPNGRLTRIDLQESCNHRGLIFSESRMSNYPKVNPHPSAEYVGYVGNTGVKLETINNEEVLTKVKDLRNSNYRFCAFAPNGNTFAILQSASRRFEILITSVKKLTSHGDKCLDLSKTFRNFNGTTMYNEHLECKWSPDSSYIAVCTSIGKMVVLTQDLEIVADVFEDILPSSLGPSWSSAFDFHPRSCHDVLAVGGTDRCLYVLSLEKGEVVYQTENLTHSKIDCITYSKDGSKLAVSLSDYQILLLNSDTLDLEFRIEMKASVPNLGSNGFFLGIPSVMRVCFTERGEHLATASCDGRVRVWQLPVDISLHKLCKWEILKHVPLKEIKNLPLPKKIIDEMLMFPS